MKKDKLASLTESVAVEKCEDRIKSLNDEKKDLRNLVVEKTKLLTEMTKLMLIKLMPEKEQPEHISRATTKTEGSQSNND